MTSGVAKLPAAVSMQKQIDLLRDEIVAGLNEIKTLLKSMDERIRKLENTDASCIPLLSARLDDHEKRLTLKSQQIANITDQMAKLMIMYRMVSWVATVAGGAIIALIISILTHQVQVVFP